MLRNRISLLTGLLGLGALSYFYYTKDVHDFQETERLLTNSAIKQEVERKTELTPYSVSFVIDIAKIATPQLITEKMYSSWIIWPEKILLKLFMSDYQPLSLREGTLIYGMFKVEVSNSDNVILSWKMGNLAGLHVFSIVDNKAKFATLFWTHGSINRVLQAFHIVYSKLLLASVI